ncbi:hypothetical protein DFH08DRAFT_865607, partial [Mycena albidolilacea]
SAREQELVDALRESEDRDDGRKRAMVGMQAGVVLAGMYASRETQNGDGKAKYFTGDEFFQLAVDDERQRKEEEAGKEQRKVQREARAVELAAWQKKNDLIRERNEAKKIVFAVDLGAWEAEKTAAKEKKRKRLWEKPKWKDYSPEVLLARPKKLADEDEDSENGSETD